MNRTIKILLTGLGISFFGALPFGTLNITAFQIAASKSISEGVLFAFAVVFVEIVVVRLTLISFVKKDFSKKLSFYLYPIAILLITYLSLVNFGNYNKNLQLEATIYTKSTLSSPILLGLLLSALNPFQIPFWMGWNTILISKKILDKSFYSILSYLLGIGIGTLSALLAFILLGSNILENRTEYSSVISLLMGFLYLGFSIYLIVLFYKKHKQKIQLINSKINSYTRLKLYQVTHWEFWPMWAIYYPLFPVWLYLAMRAKSFFFFNAANPKITNGGMVMESKKEIYDMIPNQFIPKTILITNGEKLSKIQMAIEEASIEFPFIAKPDIGMKGFGVEKINTIYDLKLYLDKISVNFLIQEYIDFPNEIGVFYVRQPNEKRGKITGIVSKEFLSVTGNGKDSLLNLIKQNPRSHFQLSTLKKKYKKIIHEVLPVGKNFVLVPFGSHTRGARFIDDSNKVTNDILNVVDAICMELPEFHYGRLDIRLNSFEDLAKRKSFSIIEINGAGSEPTHIYDSKHSIFFAWKEIVRHWYMMCKISLKNKEKGYTYLSFKEGKAIFKANRILEQHLKVI
ncbi:hypothetical protein [Psychroserpens sp.]|uniref:hypothetical protein n=1 Tax=Psychroserpens sp. TaxID=2020870 RepID=UPI002AA6F03D|nr:hypothetical protein [Psychroserpens sp.]